MSVSMEAQDLRGYLRGLCLVVVVRTTGRELRRADIEKVLHEDFALDVCSLLAAIASFTGVGEGILTSAVEELFGADDSFLETENINLQLGLLCGRPVPIFPFVKDNAVNQVALLRPFLDTARNLLHVAVRLRMQSPPLGSPSGFWRTAAEFLRRVGGDDDVAAGIALGTIANVVSDVLLFNSDAPERTADRALATSIARVLEELRTIDIADAAR